MPDANTLIFITLQAAEKRRIEQRFLMGPRWKTVLWIAGGLAVASMAALIVASVLISRQARVWAQDWMTREYNGNVDLSSFRIAIPFPLVQCEGEDLAIHFQGRPDLPPLIAVKRFTMRTSLLSLLRRSRRIQYLRLEGLQINVPPRENQNGSGAGKDISRKFKMVRFDEILTDNAIFRMLTQKPVKDPLEFDIPHLRLNSTGTDGALAFHADLFNPKPPGEIVSTGTFGPWNSETPSLTPVSGTYDFQKADLGAFPGIAGTLTSKGSYEGVLEKISVDGTTDAPDFRVLRAGHPVDLSTSFHATVDGTDGDTYLQPVEAHFGKSILIAQGTVEGTKGQTGKTVTLDVSADRARIEDLLLLAMKESPSMSGPIRLKTKLNLKPGPKEVPDRLNLDGFFQLDSLHFRSSTVQQKVDNMSKRSQGKPQEVVNPEEAISSDDVAGAMKGNFRLGNGILTLTGLTFEIPGTDVQLDGTYALDAETLDIRGNVKMQAKLSQTTTGVKSFLLRFADPVFSKAGKGTVLPIKIAGPVQHPRYGLDLGHKGGGSTELR